MKSLLMLAIPCMLCFGAFETIRAEEKVEIKEKDKDGKHEFKMKVKKDGDNWIGVYDNRNYILRGDVVTTTVKEPGEYTVWGGPSTDNTYITTEKITRTETTTVR